MSRKHHHHASVKLGNMLPLQLSPSDWQSFWDASSFNTNLIIIELPTTHKLGGLKIYQYNIAVLRHMAYWHTFSGPYRPIVLCFYYCDYRVRCSVLNAMHPSPKVGYFSFEWAKFEILKNLKHSWPQDAQFLHEADRHLGRVCNTS